MRKIKKINGYLIVRFNDRELREWEGAGLGTYGVIDAELYTGTLEIDRGVMEYDDADTLEQAIEQARGLESELDVSETAPTVTIVKETDHAINEYEIDDPQLMISGWKTTLERQVANKRYPDVDPRTAAHELYGYMVALKDLGLLPGDECYVEPGTFGQDEARDQTKAKQELDGLIRELHYAKDFQERRISFAEARAYLRALVATQTITEQENELFLAEIKESSSALNREQFTHLPEKSRGCYAPKVYALGLALTEDCPQNDCTIFLNIFRMCQELDAQIGRLEGRPRELLERELKKSYHELEGMFLMNHAVRNYRREAEPGEV